MNKKYLAEISADDFCDEISKEIFIWRKKFLETNDYKSLLHLVCYMHGHIAANVNADNQNFIKKLQGNKCVYIFGAGEHGMLIMNFLKRHNVYDKVAGFIDNSLNKTVFGGDKSLSY